MRFDVHRKEATPGARSICPCCSAPVKAKCGAIVVHHWAHDRSRDCDPWYDTGAHGWHLDWQRQHPDDQCEVVIGNHRADLLIDGMVVEFQHSPLSPAQIREREEFYLREVGDMLWVWDARAFAKRIEVTKFVPETGGVSFRWKTPRKSMFTCRARSWWDVGSGWALKEVRAFAGKYAAGCGTAFLRRHDTNVNDPIGVFEPAELRAILTPRISCQDFCCDVFGSKSGRGHRAPIRFTIPRTDRSAS